MLHSVSKPELLAPAGDMECIRAAATNGASAVYFGLSNFNARQRAPNFSPGNLSDLVAFLHDRNVRAYLALNTLLFPSELTEAATYVEVASQAGVDAVIVQDLGIASLVRRMSPTLPIHASTQMTLTDARGIALARTLGVSRVILPRELPLEAIGRVARECGIPVEVFVHGALCVCYSGQCLASMAIGGRSANRGQCAQPCRLPYDLIVDGQPHDLAGRRRLLSPQDLCAVDLIPALIKAGVAAFKIEGRLKSAEYVAIATRVYRRAIDDAIAGRAHKPDTDSLAHLEQAFSRGWGHGHLEDTNRTGLVDGRTEGNRGVRLGTVTGTTARGVILQLDRPGLEPRPGDGLVIETTGADEAGQGGRVYAARAVKGKGGAVEIEFGEGAVDLSAVATGAVVRRTDDPALRKRVQSVAPRPVIVDPTPMDICLSARVGGEIAVKASTPDGCTAEARWPGPVNAATTHPATESLVRDQFSRLGDTPFELAKVQVSLPDAALLPKSVLNELRRSVVAELLTQRHARARHAVAEPGALAAMRREIAVKDSPTATRPRLYVLVRELDQLAALADGARPDMVYCDFPSPRACAAAIGQARKSGLSAAAVTPRVQLPGEDEDLAPIVDAAPDAVLVRTLGALSFLRERAPAIPLIADFSLNAANELAVRVLRELGAVRATAAYDLDFRETLRLLESGAGEEVEIALHKHVPFMHTEHCVCSTFVTGAERACGQFCRKHRVALRDRMNVDHPMRTDAWCRTTVYFGKASSALDDAQRFVGAGCRHFRIELLDEGPAETLRLAREAGQRIGVTDAGDTQ